MSARLTSPRSPLPWAVSGQNVYTTNYLTNDINSYTAGRQGSLTLNAPVAGGAQPGATPLVTPIGPGMAPGPSSPPGQAAN